MKSQLLSYRCYVNAIDAIPTLDSLFSLKTLMVTSNKTLPTLPQFKKRVTKKSFSTTWRCVLTGPLHCPTIPLCGGADMIVRSHSRL